MKQSRFNSKRGRQKQTKLAAETFSESILRMGFENRFSGIFYDIDHRISILTFRKPNGLTRRREVTMILGKERSDDDTGQGEK